MKQTDTNPPDADLLAGLAALPGAGTVETRADGLWMTAPLLDVEAMARAMTALGARMVTVTGLARDDGETTVIYHYARGSTMINLRTVSRNGAMPSLAPLVKPASWVERELHDFFAVKFIGHPNLAPLFRPPGLTEGFFRAPDQKAAPASSSDQAISSTP